MYLIEDLQEEIERNRGILKMLGGRFESAVIRNNVANAENAIESGNIVEMARSLKQLQNKLDTRI